MGRAPCCSKIGLHKGPWTPREDALLTKYIQAHGEGQWRSLPKRAGLLRCGKSCRLRWMNYLRPDIKRGNITPEEDDLIIRMHSLLGNRWSLIAGRIPGRTDNEIKNYWNTHLSKKRTNNQTTTDHDPAAGKGKKKVESDEKEKKSLVYLPKAIRVTTSAMANFSSSSSCILLPTSDSTTSFTLESNHHHAFQEKELEYDDHQQQEEGVVVVVGNDYFDLVNKCDVESPKLDKLYQECLQLLKNPREEDDDHQLDSFAQSLLA